MIHTTADVRRFCLLALTAIATLGAVSTRAETPAASKGPIRVVIFNDVGAGDDGAINLERCLLGTEFTTRRVKGSDIRDGALDGADVLIHPGGSASKQSAALSDLGRERVRKFVETGGGYVGICAGAYLATADYTWSLGILDAKVIDRAHWARGTGPVELKLSEEGCKFFAIPHGFARVYYAQGPLLAPGNRPEVPDYQELAAFQTEIAKKGAPTGVMIGTTAAALAGSARAAFFASARIPRRRKGVMTSSTPRSGGREKSNSLHFA